MAPTTDAVFARRLRALGYPFVAALDDAVSLQRVVCWAEDTVIRRWPVERRRVMRSADFEARFGEYVADLGGVLDGVVEGVAWVVGVAVRELYADGSARFNAVVDPWKGRCVPVVKGAVGDPAVARSVTLLLNVLGVGVKGAVVDGARVAAGLAEGIGRAEDRGVYNLDALCLGFATGDDVVDRVARVLRVLYVRELRALQNRINAAIAAMQTVTADPKTDARLGKVGRG